MCVCLILDALHLSFTRRLLHLEEGLEVVDLITLAGRGQGQRASSLFSSTQAAQAWGGGSFQWLLVLGDRNH